MPPRPADPNRPGPTAQAASIAAVIVLAAGAGHPDALQHAQGAARAGRQAADLARAELRRRPAPGHAGRGPRARPRRGRRRSWPAPPTCRRSPPPSRRSRRAPGHACACALEVTGELTGTVLVTYGDVPLLRPSTLHDPGRRARHQRQRRDRADRRPSPTPPATAGSSATTPATCSASSSRRTPTTPSAAIREINSGVYAFDGAVLTDALGRLSDANAAGERYLTDVRRHRPRRRPPGRLRAGRRRRSRPRASTTGCSSPSWPGCSTPGWSARPSWPASPCTTRPPPGSTPTSPSARTPRSCPAPSCRPAPPSAAAARSGRTPR